MQEDRERIAAHLGACSECARVVASMMTSRTPVISGGQPSGSSETTVLASATAALPSGSGIRGLSASFGAEPAVGDVVLGYRVIDRLGHGGMGVTWKAKRDYEVEPVAIKTLPDALRFADVELNRVRRIFELVKSLRHPNIAMVFQLGTDPKWGPVLVMELVLGVTLRRYRDLKADPLSRLPLSEVIRIVEPVADALDYSHKCGVVHRDIKPGNVMLREDGEGVRLIDFGLGDEIRHSIADVSVEVGPVAGTAAYMAPEQWRGHVPSPATDQYSLGCLAYELLSGHPPFVSSDPTVLRQCHIAEPVVELPDAPAALSRIFWREGGGSPSVLSKQRNMRFPNCTAFVLALKQALKEVVGPTAQRAQVRDASGEFRPPEAPSGPQVPFFECPTSTGFPESRAFRDLQHKTSRHYNVPRSIDLETGMVLVLIPAGSFTLGLGGTPLIDELGQERPRRVTIERPFYLARWPVTLGEWTAAVGTSPPVSTGAARGAGGPEGAAADAFSNDHPVDAILFPHATEFLARLNARPQQQKNGRPLPKGLFRLPTEAEWEFAARGGGTTTYHFGSDSGELSAHAWYRDDCAGRPEKTAMLRANVLSLHDMHGNVWEWCQGEVLRGGCCTSPPEELASWTRLGGAAVRGILHTGIRIAADLSIGQAPSR